jgi:hypothetical protein
VIATTVLRELAELDNADLEVAVARFIRAAHMVALENDPRTASGEASVHTGKPGSRAPGREQCAGAVRRLVHLAQSAENTALTARKEREHRIESMGGITIAAPNGVAVSRRETRITTHLHGKLVEAYKVGGTD